MDSLSSTTGAAYLGEQPWLSLSDAMLQTFREFAALNQDPPPDEKYFTDICHPMNLPSYVHTVGDLDRYYRYMVHCMIDGDEPTGETDIDSVEGQIFEGMEGDEEDDAMPEFPASVAHEGLAME
ncbi:hypothetical protein ACP4OV_027400 [Aristida adscensionis]